MPKISERVTIAEVARSAGVSVPTVSKVLNDRGDVAAETRARVQDALTEHNYRPRARKAPIPSARLVELVITDLDTSYALEVVKGAEEETARLGAGLIVTTTHDHSGTERDWLRSVMERHPDGIVLLVPRIAVESIDRIARLHGAVVLLDPVGGTDPSLPTVGATNFAGGVAATEHLLSRGHRRIGLITGMPSVLCSQERLEGYRAALTRAGVPVDEGLVRFGNFRASGGRREAAALLSLPDPPTAIFAGSDMQASGVYQEARTRGLWIPKDLSVVGFDDVSICRFLSPPLTTVRQPLADMASEAVHTALELAARGRSFNPSHVQLTTRLVERESTAAPREEAAASTDRDASIDAAAVEPSEPAEPLQR